MERHGIPTAAVYGIYEQAVDAYTDLCSVDWPLVIKADGLAAGKGVLVTSSPDEATAFIDRVMERKEFGEAGRRVLLEEGLQGVFQTTTLNFASWSLFMTAPFSVQ